MPESLPPSTAPAPKEKLSTTLGLLVNELHRSPDMLVAAAKGFRTRISELDPGTSRGVAEGGHAAAILYALRLLSRRDGYAAMAARLAEHGPSQAIREAAPRMHIECCCCDCRSSFFNGT